ncbi:MAG TPA: helix-turn-helix domain-containing protein [Casimicrobiaceae bacterium]
MQTAIAARAVTPFRTTTKAFRPVLHDISRPAVSCSNCNLHKICMPVDIKPEAAPLFDHMVGTRIRLRKGDVLFRAGDRFASLYAIRTGSCKTVMLTDDGNEQVAGYHLPGDIIGAEGIAAEMYGCQAVALEDTEVCTLPFDRVEALAHEDPAFQHRVYRLLGDAILRERSIALMLGTMRAEQRLASFLLDLAQRYHARGYSSTEFVLRMTREEIGSHLGLKLETVSRLFSRFDEEGLIQARGRVIKLLDRIGLQQLIAVS